MHGTRRRARVQLGGSLSASADLPASRSKAHCCSSSPKQAAACPQFSGSRGEDGSPERRPSRVRLRPQIVLDYLAAVADRQLAPTPQMHYPPVLGEDGGLLLWVFMSRFFLGDRGHYS